ncbi:sodium/glucose cotransporter 1-like [Clavelina lepadiformis]|uniref:sodium/glucose cotransporter 1-like n=1 Tax=Clavelina lepadiformis TaxID=159417 RepID=UPI004042F35E
MEATTVVQTFDTTEPPLPPPGLSDADIGVIVAYFVVILGVGIWAMCRTNRGNINGFFLAGRDITWFPVGASLYSSNIGSGHFVGLAGTGAAAGIATGAFEWNAMITLLVLGWVFAPIYIASGVVTMPEYLRERFGGQRIRMFLSTLSLILYIFTKISADLFAGAIFIEEAIGLNLYLAICALLAITALYTITGGLAAVIYTDTAQTFIMVIGGLIMMVLSFDYIGGYNQLETKYMNAIPDDRPPNTTCGLPRPDSFHVLRDPINGDLPWPGVIFGITVNSIWYWCTDQVIVQRTLAAKNLSHAKGGCVMAGLLKVLPMYMMVMVGMISRVIFTNSIACATPETCKNVCGSSAGCTNYAYAKLVLFIMPDGLKGLLLAVMIASLMSSLTSVFNSASTLFTCDIWTKIRPKASNKELMIIGRLFMLIMVGISIAWVPIIQVFADGKLFDYIQSITSFLAPPITTVFVMAVFWPRMNEPGTFWGLILGMIIGIVRMILEFAMGSPACGQPDFRPTILSKVHYLYFSLILAACTLIISVCVTLLTPPINKKCLIRLTWWTRLMKRKRLPIADFMNKTKAKKNGHTNDGFDGNPNTDVENTSNNEKRLSISDNSVQINASSKPLWRKAFDLFCGFDESESDQSLAQQEEMMMALTDITEEKWPAIYVNVAGLVMCCAGVFLFAYYA